jgi:hypothetical protein
MLDETGFSNPSVAGNQIAPGLIGAFFQDIDEGLAQLITTNKIP